MRRSATWITLALGTALAVAGGASRAGAELVPFRVIEGKGIQAPLTGQAGDPTRGERIATDRALGNCLACHALPVAAKLQGNVGPDLRGVAGRLSEGELRLRVVDPKRANPDTAMPSYYRVDGLFRVRKDMVGRPLLSAEQIEDVIAYLLTLHP